MKTSSRQLLGALGTGGDGDGFEIAQFAIEDLFFDRPADARIAELGPALVDQLEDRIAAGEAKFEILFQGGPLWRFPKAGWLPKCGGYQSVENQRLPAPEQAAARTEILKAGNSSMFSARLGPLARWLVKDGATC